MCKFTNITVMSSMNLTKSTNWDASFILTHDEHMYVSLIIVIFEMYEYCMLVSLDIRSTIILPK